MSAPAPLTRRALLFGESPVGTVAMRPPRAVEAGLFAERCTRCDDCVRACPEQVLVRDGDGLPRFDPTRGECTFCGDCVQACASGALQASVAPPWELRASVHEGCLPAHGVVCASCREVCPESAIHVAPGARGAATVDAARCSGCGACVAICPVGAITLAALPQEAMA
ncbi:ferredoxin-type protein NapF [Pseudoxanthomonas sp. NC8]|nr:ferredoxin-type protein NapF [Pseudoxanthomonas sp. NC8]